MVQFNPNNTHIYKINLGGGGEGRYEIKGLVLIWESFRPQGFSSGTGRKRHDVGWQMGGGQLQLPRVSGKTWSGRIQSKRTLAGLTG